jgi:hypothetical protein
LKLKLISVFLLFLAFSGIGHAQTIMGPPPGSTWYCSYAQNGGFAGFPPPMQPGYDMQGSSGLGCSVRFMISLRQSGNHCAPLTQGEQWVVLGQAPVPGWYLSFRVTIFQGADCHAQAFDIGLAQGNQLSCPPGTNSDDNQTCDCPSGPNPYPPPYTIPYHWSDTAEACEPDSAYFNPFITPYFGDPTSVFVPASTGGTEFNNGNVFVAKSSTHTVQISDASSLTLLGQFGTENSTQLSGPPVVKNMAGNQQSATTNVYLFYPGAHSTARHLWVLNVSGLTPGTQYQVWTHGFAYGPTRASYTVQIPQ